MKLIPKNQNGITLQQKGKSLRPNTNRIADAYEKVATAMESQFAQHMITELRKSVPKVDGDSAGMKFYNSLLDKERADALAKRGLGVKEMILKQIYPQHPLLQNQKVQHQAGNEEIKKYQKPTTLPSGQGISLKEG